MQRASHRTCRGSYSWRSLMEVPLSNRAVADINAPITLAARLLVYAMPALFLIGKAPPDIALSIIGVLFLVRSRLANDWSWLRTPWVTVGLYVWLYLVLASFAADDTGSALGRSVPWVRFVVFAAALQHWVLSDQLRRKRLLVCTGAVLAFVAADTFFQFYFSQDVFGISKYSSDRLTGPLRDPPPKVGAYVLRLMFPVLVALMFWAATNRRSLIANISAIAAVCLGVTTILISGERMPFILALFGLGMALILVPGMKRALLAATLAVGLSVAGFFAFSETVSNRSLESSVSTIGNFWQSHYGRIWLSSFRVADAHPLFGVGLKNFRTACPNEAYGALDDSAPRCDLHPHNMYLEWLAEAGVIGLGGFLCLIGLWTRHFAARAGHWRHDPTAVGAVVAVITFLWPIASTMSFFTNWHAALFWLVLGWALAATGDGASARAPAREAV